MSSTRQASHTGETKPDQTRPDKPEQTDQTGQTRDREPGRLVWRGVVTSVLPCSLRRVRAGLIFSGLVWLAVAVWSSVVWSRLVKSGLVCRVWSGLIWSGLLSSDQTSPGPDPRTIPDQAHPHPWRAHGN